MYNIHIIYTYILNTYKRVKHICSYICIYKSYNLLRTYYVLGMMLMTLHIIPFYSPNNHLRIGTIIISDIYLSPLRFREVK